MKQQDLQNSSSEILEDTIAKPIVLANYVTKYQKSIGKVVMVKIVIKFVFESKDVTMGSEHARNTCKQTPYHCALC